MTITVHKVDDDTFEVTVLSVKKTSHLVTISDETHQKLTDSRTSKETLLDYSFKFLESGFIVYYLPEDNYTT